jgi:hypothetical protein
VNSRITRRFRRAFAELPADVKDQARDAYRPFRGNPYHPSLRFKQVHPAGPIYAVRIGLGYRTVGIREEDTIYWYEIDLWWAVGHGTGQGVVCWPGAMA